MMAADLLAFAAVFVAGIITDHYLGAKVTAAISGLQARVLALESKVSPPAAPPAPPGPPPATG